MNKQYKAGVTILSRSEIQIFMQNQPWPLSGIYDLIVPISPNKRSVHLIFDGAINIDPLATTRHFSDAYERSREKKKALSQLEKGIQGFLSKALKSRKFPISSSLEFCYDDGLDHNLRHEKCSYLDRKGGMPLESSQK